MPVSSRCLRCFAAVRAGTLIISISHSAAAIDAALLFRAMLPFAFRYARRLIDIR